MESGPGRRPRGTDVVGRQVVLSGYWALLSICTPTWHRNAVEVADRGLFVTPVPEHFPTET